MANILVRIEVWDCREQPDWEEIQVIVNDDKWRLYPVEDTQSDEYALVFSSVALSDDQVQFAWDHKYYEEYQTYWEGWAALLPQPDLTGGL
jgi:hypothetical protein